MLGRNFDDEDIREFARNEWTFGVLKSEDGQCMVEVPGKEPVGIVEATAMILKGVKESVKHLFDGKSSEVKAVVTVLASDSD